MLDFFIVVFCLILNAFFSAYEMAFVTISKEAMSEMEDTQPSLLKRLSAFKKNPERTLSVIQIGITLVGAIAAAVGGTGAVESLEPYIVENYNFSRSFAEAIAVTIVIVPLTYFSVVFGELVPKTIALKYPVKIILLGTNILRIIDRLLSPVVTFLELSTHLLLRIIGLYQNQSTEEHIQEKVEIGHLPQYHQRFVKNLVSLKGLRVKKAMIPWDKITYLDFSDTEEEVRDKVMNTPYSRFPVIDGDIIVGILLKKELPSPQQQTLSPWQGNLKPALKVKDDEPILEAFLKMQEKQNLLAIVIGKDGNFVGVITIKDILEEVVGDINDYADYTITSKVLSNRPRIQLK